MIKIKYLQKQFMHYDLAIEIHSVRRKHVPILSFSSGISQVVLYFIQTNDIKF